MKLTALEYQPPGPTRQTAATAKTVARLDRAASAALRACWLVINAALWTAVRVVLVMEHARSVAALDRSGYERDHRGRYVGRFHCGWCGSVTPENSRFALTCCAMASDEYWRRTEPALFEQWTGRSA